jgi:hypothetical protein
MSKEHTLDQRIRRLARRFDLIVRKSQKQRVLENRGGYMIVDPLSGIPVAGFQYDLSSQEVIEYFTN